MHKNKNLAKVRREISNRTLSGRPETTSKPRLTFARVPGGLPIRPTPRDPIVAGLAVAGIVAVRPTAAQDDPAGEFYQLLNQARLDAGLAPLGFSTLLAQAAQRHAEDISQLGQATSEGSDGSTYRQRIREAGYRAWNDGLLTSEVNWMGLGDAADAVNWFRNNAEQWELLTDPRYREVGIGYDEDADGVRYFVITLGSRPGVLPIFINDGAETTDSPQVAVRLTNEQAEPLGEGAWIGKAIEVRLNDTPEFDEAPWQPWEPLLPWQLASTEPGSHAVYVEYRDGAGRTAVAEDTIRLVAPGEAPPTPTPLLITEPLTPTATIPPEETEEADGANTPTPSPTAGATEETLVPLTPTATLPSSEPSEPETAQPPTQLTPRPHVDTAADRCARRRTHADRLAAGDSTPAPGERRCCWDSRPSCDEHPAKIILPLRRLRSNSEI